MIEHQVCKTCVMDTSDPGLYFDEDGRCSVCHAYEAEKAIKGYHPGESEKRLQALVTEMKRDGKNKDYDAILGLSGGVDSAYLLYVAHTLGLRVLAVHVDTGWNSEIAVHNIQRMCDRLGIQLHTIVIDWLAMKELQRAYLLSGVANLDVPQDHAFMSALRKFAKKYRQKYLLSGSNLATEGVGSPFSLQQSYMDTRHMRSIYRRNGRGKSIRKYPLLPLFKAFWMQLTVRQVTLLNHIPYSKKEAIEVLSREFGWEYYGGKHFESRFTKYFQSVYLPRKFKYDKRKHHLSCLVLNGEITRQEALCELNMPPYSLTEQKEDEAYILKKLEIDPGQWQRILDAPPTPNSDYPSWGRVILLARRLWNRRK